MHQIVIRASRRVGWDGGVYISNIFIANPASSPPWSGWMWGGYGGGGGVIEVPAGEQKGLLVARLRPGNSFIYTASLPPFFYSLSEWVHSASSPWNTWTPVVAESAPSAHQFFLRREERFPIKMNGINSLYLLFFSSPRGLTEMWPKKALFFFLGCC